MHSKLLLLEDVDNLGRKGEVVTARRGYAYNFLIPQRHALFATKDALRRQKKLQDERELIASQDRKIAQEIAQRLEGETVAFQVKVDHDGHMYGSVSVLDIIDAVKLQTGIELEKKAIQLKHPIKATGVYDMVLRLKENTSCTIHVKVAPEHEVAAGQQM